MSSVMARIARGKVVADLPTVWDSESSALHELSEVLGNLDQCSGNEWQSDKFPDVYVILVPAV